MTTDIIDFLQKGDENAKSMIEGANFYNESPRSFRARINKARRQGAVILSNSNKDRGGYYLPKSNNEIRRYIAFQDRRINSAFEAKRSAEELLKRGGINGADER